MNGTAEHTPGPWEIDGPVVVDGRDRIIADLEALDIRAALAGIDQSLPGWPSGGNGGSNPELDDNGDPRSMFLLNVVNESLKSRRVPPIHE